MSTWDDAPDEEPLKLTGGGAIRIALRGLLMLIVLIFGVVLMAFLRLVERPLFGQKRPVTPWITVYVCKACLIILGLAVHKTGAPMTANGGLVANHSAWLDIFTLNATRPLYFVSKAEVAKWPGIGLLARITGTMFISRDPKEAKRQQTLFDARLQSGHRLLFFPEGTSTDGLRVLPFKSTLFQAYFNKNLSIQPVTMIYHAPEGRSPRFYGWWGDMEFGEHLIKTLAAPRQGHVEIIYHAPLLVDDYRDRKALAMALETTVRNAMPKERQLSA